MGRKKKITPERMRQVLNEEIWITIEMSKEKTAVRSMSIRKAVERIFKEYEIRD